MKNSNQHSQETIERMKANAEAAKRRLGRLNEEYQLRRQAQKPAQQKPAVKRETFAEAVVRIARQDRVAM